MRRRVVAPGAAKSSLGLDAAGVELRRSGTGRRVSPLRGSGAFGDDYPRFRIAPKAGALLHLGLLPAASAKLNTKPLPSSSCVTVY